MELADFRYRLPDQLIAQHPLPNRSDSRLLCLDGQTGERADRRFRDLVGLLQPGDLMVFNDTRVIPARLYGTKETGGKVEILIERVRSPHRAIAHLRASKAPRPGSSIQVREARLEVTGRDGDLFQLDLPDGFFADLMERHGHIPLPPYIDRADRDLDRERYQTVYGEREGAVAAPTAGLHFDVPLLDALRDRGVQFGRLTLHVGAGTFQPVRTACLEDHVMHSEYLEVDERLVDQVGETRAQGGRVVAVGTTSVRGLETAATGGELRSFTGDTRLFLRPGSRFHCVDALVTNFHLPESTLLMLVCAFAGYQPVMAAYQHAVEAQYRFFSYGDAMFLSRVETA